MRTLPIFIQLLSLIPAIKMNHNLIIAKYNEDVSWLSTVKGYKIFIYDKSKDLPNIGREAHTYIYHIVKNYENLSEINVFSQANPFDHCPEFIDKLEKVNTKYKYFEFSNIEISCNKKGEPDHPDLPIEKIFKHLFPHKKCPEHFYSKGNAIFAVNKKRILFHPKEFYERALDLFDIEKAPYAFERLWNIIFSGNLINYF